MELPHSTPDHLEMIGVKERCEEMPVFLNEMDSVLYVRAYNQCGYDATDVNLSQLIKWLHENRPDLLVSALPNQR